MNEHQPSGRDIHYFHSRIFKRLFFSYVLVILGAALIYSLWYLRSYSESYRRSVDIQWQQQTTAFANRFDQQLLTAQIICTQINASETCRDFLKTVYVEKKPVNSMQLYNLLGELSRIKGAGGNSSIYNLCLAFQGDTRAYLAGSVVSLGAEAGLLEEAPYLGLANVSSLLDFPPSSNLVLSKEFLIYGSDYTGFGHSSSVKGCVLILFDPSVLFSSVRPSVPGAQGCRIARDGSLLLMEGDATASAYTASSASLSGVSYTVYAPDSDFAVPFPLSALVPIFAAVLIGILFILLTFSVARRYYKPIDDIQHMIRPGVPGPETPNGRSEFDMILSGIEDLIVERNGYKEKMVTITPFAEQGILQAMISGRAGSQAKILVDDHFTDLKRTYYAVGLISTVISGTASPTLYADARVLLRQAAAELSCDDITVVTTPQGECNLYVIASADTRESFEGFFYTLYQRCVDALDASGTSITIGVSDIESDLERLPIACENAAASLGQILTGGRGSVYFYEPEVLTGRSYYFPHDAQQQMDKALSRRDLAALNAILDEIYQKNVVQSELPVSQIRQMADEVYWTIRKSLRHTYATSPVHIQMEGIRDGATIDEIFAYYHKVFETALQSDAAALTDEGSLEDAVCSYIEAHLYSPDLSLSALSDQFGISAKMIGSICKKRYGQTFLSYVHDRQIRHAAELLQTTDDSLESIAEQCGFTNLLTFRRNFKSVMGINPSDYRK